MLRQDVIILRHLRFSGAVRLAESIEKKGLQKCFTDMALDMHQLK